ncbi:hypothetical protein [Caballeronia sordidicola]|uniref:hypothetical protein n=1 Tax=Caballeronia sordidicola TaxID=196367 RepID=UPI0004D03BC1|nr:hypothetical protein [Caballeronia sordidicola]
MTDDIFRYRGKRYKLRPASFYRHDPQVLAESKVAAQEMFKGVNCFRLEENKEFIEHAKRFLRTSSAKTGDGRESASSIVFDVSVGIRWGDILVVESPIGGRAGSYSGGSAPPAAPAYRPPAMTPKQAFSAAALARSGGAVQSLGYDSGLERVAASAAPYAQSAVSAPLFSDGPAGALVGGIRALVTLVNMGFLRLDEPEGAIDLGEVTDVGSATTPLGDAAPLEYVKSVTGDDVMSLAARGVSEAQETECFAQYERDMDECTAYRSAMGGQRFMDTCSQQAFMNYQQCRGY